MFLPSNVHFLEENTAVSSFSLSRFSLALADIKLNHSVFVLWGKKIMGFGIQIHSLMNKF